MIINNKLDKSFGPIGTIAGITIFVVGVILIYFSLSGLFLILIGAFVGFTSTFTTIDIDNKRVRFSNNLFGIIKTGQWIKLESNMKIEIKQSNKTWRAYSRGNRSVDITDKDFRLFLINENNKQIMPLMKTISLEKAKTELESLTSLLGLSQS